MPDLELVSITTASSFPRIRLHPARQAAFSLSFLESYFKSTRRKVVCQKQVRSLAIAAGPLAEKN